MARPLLQIALDDVSLDDAYQSLANGVDEVVDIIECGTVLFLAEGKKAIISLREKYPNKLLVADFKIADSGKVMADLILEGKPDYMTVICSANDKTKKAVVDEIKNKNLNTQVQIELYGKWDFEDIDRWKDLGINHVVLHHSVDDSNDWSKEEIDIVRKLCDKDIKVTVTGGINVDNLILFEGLPIYCIIAGRSIRKADNPYLASKQMKDKIIEIWGD